MDGVSLQHRGDTYRFRCNARARFLFEKASGYSVQRLLLFSGVNSDVEESLLVWALLEGDRLYRVRVGEKGAREAPWTVDEILDGLLDDADGAERVEMRNAAIQAVNECHAGLPEADEDDEGKDEATG